MPSRAATYLVTSFVLGGCAIASDDERSPEPPADERVPCGEDCDTSPGRATREDLLAHLLAQMDRDTVVFGQERFNVTGVNTDGTQWLATAGAFDRSDAKTVTGDHPIVFGFDAWDLAIKPDNWTPTGKDHADAAKHVHAKGGIVEIAFHMHGCNEGTFNATGNEDCLCRAANNDGFARSWLIGQYAKVADAITKHGLDKIPLIFRPLHEHNGNWFWWGQAYWDCARYVPSPRFTGAEAYARVYRTIVSYLRTARGLDNLLIAYSPGGDSTDYLAGYPGDEYVDLFGADLYYQPSPAFDQQTQTYRGKLAAISRLAREHHKPAALTEIGNTQLATDAGTQHWFTEHLLPLVTGEGVDLAYAMTWENRTSGPQQFWVPYPSHPGANDFRVFESKAETLFLGDAPAFDAPPADGYPVCATCTSDSDGDRWGWENDKSCRVASWCLQPQYPACVKCASDPDGDGWGWETEKSCIVYASCQ